MLKIKNKLAIVAFVLILLLVTAATAAASYQTTKSAGKTIKPDARLDVFSRVGYEPHLVIFTDISYKGGTPTWKVWNFGDGQYSTSMGKKVMHIYTKPGTYYVSLKTGNSAGFDIDKDIVKVYKYPLPG